jgi:predicted nucleic acid-binding protein
VAPGIANSFQTAIRRKRVTVAFRDRALEALATVEITVDPNTGDHAWATTLHLSDRFRLTAYDAAYLELAQRMKLPLASLDQQLHRAAAALGLQVLGR